MDKLTRHQILLFEGDFERLKNIHTGKLSPTGAIRMLVRNHLERIEAKLREVQNERQQA
jgi:hypothetical protein